MAKVSRRKLIAGAALAPFALANGVAPDRAISTNRRAQILPTQRIVDPVVEKVTAWIADRDAIDAKMLEWQDQEVALCAKIKTIGMSLTQAYRCGLPEARAMRVLDRQIKTGLKRLERNARRVVLMPVASAEGALAKIRMGLRIQGPYDWEDYAYALAQDGCEQLALALSSCGRTDV